MPESFGSWLYVLAPIGLATVLWRWFPSCHRIGWRQYLIYVLVMTTILYGALSIVAHVASAIVPWYEVLLVLWFVITWRLAWTLWNRTVGQWGQKYVRLRRWNKSSTSPLVALIPIGRITLMALVFLPLFLSTVLTHRCKLRDGQTPASIYSRDYEHVRIPTSDGLVLDGWFIPQGNSDKTIVICHGAGANKGNFIWFLGPMLNRDYNVVFFDFRAHGGSDGRVTTWGVHEHRDVLAVVDWLKRERPAQSRVIVGLGSSQGSFALALAAEQDERIDAIVLDSPFVSPRELAHYHARHVPLVGRLVVDLVLWEMSLESGADFLGVSAERAIANMKPRPVLVIRGDGDVAMPRAHAERLYNAAVGPRAIWHATGPHSNIVTTDPTGYEQQLFSFLDAHFGSGDALSQR